MALYVNGEKVEERDIQEEVARLRPDYERVFAEQTPDEQQKQLYDWSRENVIERVLLRQAAFRDGELIPPDVIEHEYEELVNQHGGKKQFYERTGISEDEEWEVRKDIERRMRVERLVTAITGTARPPSPAAVRAFYDENIERFTAPEMVRAAHIVKHPSPDVEPEDARHEMEQILEHLRAGADFAELAGQHSSCPDDGGDLGFFPRGQMVPEFDQVVFALGVGEMSGVFETEFGFHIAKVIEKRPSRPYPFEQVRETIVQELTGQMQQKAIEDFIDREKAKATIEEK